MGLISRVSSRTYRQITRNAQILNNLNKMANKIQGYGFTKEVSDRLDAKYRQDDEKELIQWFSDLGLGSPSSPGKDNFQQFLMDGQVLCSLANKLQPGAINKVHDVSKIKIAAMRSMKCQENISFFLKWARSYGLKEVDAFQTVYLFEGTNMSSVQITLFKIGSLALSKGFSGPTIGVKVSEGNKRNFTPEQMRAGQFIPAKTSGNNQGASMAGHTPYGLGRQIIDSSSAGYKHDQTTVPKMNQIDKSVQQYANDAHGMRGARREITDETSKKYNADYSTPSKQMGNNEGANQSGMTAPGTGRQIIG